MQNWLKKAVIYQIFIDRFAGYDPKSDPLKPYFNGGNIAAITKKLPYLVDLGVSAIWLTPFLKTSDYHGYSTLDFYQVEPHFGTLKDLKNLVKACHDAHIKVIMDFTANHTSALHPFFQEALTNPTSDYRKWYYFDRDNNYLKFINFAALPKLNLDYRPAREHVIGAAEYWITELGIDGLRLDHVIGPSDGFWREFGGRIRKIKPEIVLIGEAVLFQVNWGHFRTYKLPHPRWYYFLAHTVKFPFDPISKHYIGIIDGVLDYTYYHLLKRFAEGDFDLKKFGQLLDQHFKSFPKSFALPVFIDNHDSDRFLYLIKQDHERLKEVLKFEFALDQPKIIYYGDEVGMTNDNKVFINTGWAGDLPARRHMNWSPDQKQLKLLQFYKELIKSAKANE
ncbi:MAG: alpha-amylase family glycosyl hydrolase [Candidatus Saccharimonadia bacterium]